MAGEVDIISPKLIPASETDATKIVLIKIIIPSDYPLGCRSASRNAIHHRGHGQEPVGERRQNSRNHMAGACAIGRSMLFGTLRLIKVSHPRSKWIKLRRERLARTSPFMFSEPTLRYRAYVQRRANSGLSLERSTLT